MNKKFWYLIGFMVLMTFFVLVIFFLKSRYFSNFNPIYKNSTFLIESDDKVLKEHFPNNDINLKEVTSKLVWEHLEINITENTNFENILKNTSKISENKNTLITIKFWGSPFFPNFQGRPLEKIISGEFDSSIIAICNSLKNRGNKIYIRFNPEMEIPIGIYPWQNSSIVYINAYKHFSKICKEKSPNIKLVWGPAGYSGAIEHYPGDEFVDLVTITLKSDSEIKAPWFPKEDSISNLVYRKIQRLRFIDKPMLILGSKNLILNKTDKKYIDKGIKKVENNSKWIYFDEKYFPQYENSKVEPKKFQLGLYDPLLNLTNNPFVTTEHVFIDFQQIKNNQLLEILKSIEDRGHNILLTIEPWNGVGEKNDEDVLKNITLGNYDNLISIVYEEISKIKTLVYVRFAHEMEIPIKRYTWQSVDPSIYIKAFRYFMLFPKTIPHNIKRIWGPAGDRGSLEWWPGNDVVDYVSIAIYGLPDKNITDPNMQESFCTIFNRKMWRMRFINKPVFITEFGVKGPDNYQNNWLTEASECINESSNLIGLSYFNMNDSPKAWGDIKPPVWSISEKTFNNFVQLVNKK